MQINKTTLGFLKALSKNNNREWFEENRDRYALSLENARAWVDALIFEMNMHDQIQTRSGKEALWRIYNDVRFSNDKSPYSPRFAGHLKRVKPFLRGGYYFWIKPNASRIGCGFSYPNPADLLRIRQDISENYADWKKLLASRRIKTVFGEMTGEQVKTAPRGFAKDHPAIELLRYKQFWFEKKYTDEEVISAGFLKQVNKDFKTVRPFFDYLTEVLTTDANGISTI